MFVKSVIEIVFNSNAIKVWQKKFLFKELGLDTGDAIYIRGMYNLTYSIDKKSYDEERDIVVYTCFANEGRHYSEICSILESAGYSHMDDIRGQTYFGDFL